MLSVTLDGEQFAKVSLSHPGRGVTLLFSVRFHCHPGKILFLLPKETICSTNLLFGTIKLQGWEKFW